jgi:hypothetical protein
METLANKEVIETTSLFVDLSETLLEKIDIFLSNTDLDKNQQRQLMKLFKDVYSEGYEQ